MFTKKSYSQKIVLNLWGLWTITYHMLSDLDISHVTVCLFALELTPTSHFFHILPFYLNPEPQSSIQEYRTEVYTLYSLHYKHVRLNSTMLSLLISSVFAASG